MGLGRAGVKPGSGSGPVPVHRLRISLLENSTHIEKKERGFLCTFNLIAFKISTKWWFCVEDYLFKNDSLHTLN